MTEQLQTVYFSFSIVLGLIGFVIYLVDIVRGGTKPHVFTWLVWGIVTGIGYFGQIADGGGKGALITGINSLGCFIICALALKFGEKEITRSDRISLGAAMIAILLWVVTKTPLYSMFLISLIDTLGYYPTFRKSWYKPYEESLTAFALSATMYILGVMSLEHYSIITTLYPACITFCSTMLCLYLVWRRYALRA